MNKAVELVPIQSSSQKPTTIVLFTMMTMLSLENLRKKRLTRVWRNDVALSSSRDPEKKKDFIQQEEEDYREKFANPYEAARYGYIDDVIEPRNTRFRIIRALQTMATKKDNNPPKKHGNIPL